MVLTEHTLKTDITSVITKYYIVIFKFSCQSSDYLGSVLCNTLRGRASKTGEIRWAFGLQTQNFEIWHTS